jgi:polysaccharide chain length determinant protein (PEP-CTERM system associated)
MLPGKKYTPEDFLRIALARKWLILVPTVLAAIGTFAYSRLLPDQYRASTTIMVVPQRVPENYVRPTVTADVTERLQTISQQILSRTRLERIIEEFDLYREQRKTAIMEDVVEQMRKDISLNAGAPSRRDGDTSSFSISYVAPQPRVAMQVTERIASLFVQENLEERSTLADSTSQFLQAQLEDARRRLIEHEQKLEQFRMTHAGRLPTQAQANLQMLQTTQAQLQATVDAANRDRDRLVGLEDQLGEAAEQMSATPISGGTSEAGAANQLMPAAQRLESARQEYRAMELRFKPDHPEMRSARRIIEELEAKATAEATAQPSETSPAPRPRVVPAAVAARLAGMRQEALEIRNRLETRRQEEERLRDQLRNFAARLESAPALESQLTELMRDYGTLQESYGSLKRKSEDSKIAADLERRQIGEQFKVVDGARLPERPFSPDRVRLNLMGTAGGFAFALALVVLLEYRDTTLKTDGDVVVSLALPVLAVIPAMVNASEHRSLSRRRRLWVTATASLAVLITAASVAAWKLGLLQDWIR